MTNFNCGVTMTKSDCILSVENTQIYMRGADMMTRIANTLMITNKHIHVSGTRVRLVR